MSAISLFSGCGGDTLGLTRAGFKVVAFNECKPAPIATHLLNFPDSVSLVEPVKQSGDITKVPDSVFEPYKGRVDVVFAGFPCFVKDTLVLTNSGYKEIQNVSLTDTLMTHTGKFQPIVNLQMKVYTGLLYHIQVNQRPKPIVATEEHPFYVREKKVGWNVKRKRMEPIFLEPVWKAAKDLTEHDYVGMVKGSSELSVICKTIQRKEVISTYHDALLEQANDSQIGIINSIKQQINGNEQIYTTVPDFGIDPDLGWSDKSYVWIPTSSITTTETTNENVYNFEVETDNSYIVENTIVHNCQGFSKAGKKESTDPRNQMFHQFVRVAKVTQPSFIIGENVTGLLSMKSGPREEDPLVLELIRKAFQEIGYEITYQIQEASDFGVPQSRKRLLIVGWKTDRFPTFDAASFWASVTAWGESQVLPRMESFIQPTLEGACKLQEKCIPPHFDTVAIDVSADTIVTGSPHPYVTLKANATDETYGEKTYDRLLSCGKRDSPIHSEILNLKQPCKTIICTYDHQPRLLIGLKHPDGSRYVRTLLPDELKQIQGFPSDFALSGSMKDQVVQIGNAVPPAIVQGIAINLQKLLHESQPTSPKKKLKVVRTPKV